MGFENPSTPSDLETPLSRHEKNIEKKRERFAREAEERARELDISPEEYLVRYATNQGNSREQLHQESPSAAKKLFKLGTAAGEALNRELHDKTGLQTELERQKELATRDSLTGLLNRRAFEEEVTRRQAIIHKLEQQPSGAQDHRVTERRHENPKHYSIIFIDADHFKSVNTRYGHDTGDTVLKGISEIIRKNVRENEGVVARWGGEELVALVPTDIDTACRIADRIRRVIKNTVFSTEGNIKFQVTVSLGVAPYHEQINQQIKMADMAVQAAKGDFDSVEKLSKEIEAGSEKTITIQKNHDETTRDQVQYVKNGTLSKFEPKKPEASEP